MENPYVDEMIATAEQISQGGKGILATDESIPTAGRRLQSISLDNTIENRRQFREILYTTKGLGQYISGAILYDETIYQATGDGNSFVQVLNDAGILIGIKVDAGLAPLAGTDGETATQGLDGLGERCQRYYEQGARFAKWRAVLKIGQGMPSERAITENVASLARYASICQEHGLVPIVEPEVTLGPGDYSLERAAYVNEKVLSNVFRALNTQDVILEACLVKPSMVLPGLDAEVCSKAEVAWATARVLRRTVPPAIQGIHFLSGGMGAEEATANLQQLQKEYPDAPWALSFSYGRALQDAVLKAWSGQEANVETAQDLLLNLARVNSEATRGVWNEEHPAAGAGRMQLPKLSFSSERRQPADLFNW